MKNQPSFPMLTMPTRPLVAHRGEKAKRYVPSVSTDISKTFEKYRRLAAMQHPKPLGG